MQLIRAPEAFHCLQSATDGSAQFFLQKNLWQAVGLCNNVIGAIKDIVYDPDHLPPALPLCPIADFAASYPGPSVFTPDNASRTKLVPLFPQVADWCTPSPFMTDAMNVVKHLLFELAGMEDST